MARFVLNAMKVLAVIAGLVFWLTPLHSATQVMVFMASVIVFVICTAVAGNLEEEETGDELPHSSQRQA